VGLFGIIGLVNAEGICPEPERMGRLFPKSALLGLGNVAERRFEGLGDHCLDAVVNGWGGGRLGIHGFGDFGAFLGNRGCLGLIGGPAADVEKWSVETSREKRVVRICEKDGSDMRKNGEV
jgi:hypothetical protein